MGTYFLTSLALTAIFSVVYWVRNRNLIHKSSAWVIFSVRAGLDSCGLSTGDSRQLWRLTAQVFIGSFW